MNLFIFCYTFWYYCSFSLFDGWFVCLLETGSEYASLVWMELSMFMRIASNSTEIHQANDNLLSPTCLHAVIPYLSICLFVCLSVIYHLWSCYLLHIIYLYISKYHLLSVNLLNYLEPPNLV